MKKAIKIVGYTLLGLIVVLWGVQWWLGNKIEDIIEEKIYEESGGRIQADVGSVSVRLIGRRVNIKEVRITTDTLRPVTAVRSVPYADVYLKKLEIKGIHFKKRDSSTFIRAKVLSLDLPHFFADVKAADRSRTSVDKGKGRSAETINRLFTRLEVGKIDLKLGEVYGRQYQGKDTVSYALRDFSFGVDDLDVRTRPDTLFPVCKARDMQLTFASFRNKFAQNSQLLEVDTFSLNGQEGRLAVQAIRLIPQYSMLEFARKTEKHTDWTKIQVGKVVCHRLDMQRMLTEQVLQIDSVDIQGAHISSFKNRQIEQAKRVKRLFYESVQQFPLPLSIRRIRLEDINVVYKELAEKGISPGTVTFDQLKGTFYDLTNIVRPEQPYFTLKAEGKLMDQGKLQATFLLPVDSLKPHFEVEGRLGKMSMQRLNQTIEPLAKIQVTSGEIDEMKFKITGNSHTAYVHMLFLYKDLKIRIMKEKDGHLEVRSFLSTLANGLIATANNPGRDGQPRTADGKAERDIYRSQFNYLWRTLLSGLKVSIGL